MDVLHLNLICINLLVSLKLKCVNKEIFIPLCPKEHISAISRFVLWNIISADVTQLSNCLPSGKNDSKLTTA